MDNELLVKSIRNLCKTKNIPISQLETELNFGAGLISRWTKSSPSLDKIVDIADYFHVSIDEVVGYNNQVNDTFLKVLIEQTKNKILKWHSNINNPDSLKACMPFDFTYFEIDENEQESTFYTNYKEGYILVYSLYNTNNIITPKELALFIKPTPESNYIKQQYGKNDITILYLKILYNLGSEAPDEIKAEEFKNSFIKDFENNVQKNKSAIKLNSSTELIIDHNISCKSPFDIDYIDDTLSSNINNKIK